ncbi:MAG: EAL domain-containing protein [Campylobacteraceae bacterium]|nr:EAL domain-containing protein [Campylobacteraceae bacterium]
MTLFKQMAGMLSLFLGVILASVMVLNFKTATVFIQDQLYTNAKNTAHSLGLSLSKIADPTDISTIETMINAIYDSGYYERIALVGVEGNTVYGKETDVLVSDVPQWFINAVTIQNAYATSDIMMGWTRFGTLEVSGHTGNAYRQLYRTLIDLLKTFAFIGVLVLGLLYLLLTLSLQSLKQIRDQARGIIENRFIIEPKMPFTTEFRSATVAMNAMVSKVKDIFERENETLIQYQELLYKDAETKLYNRRYLMTKLPEYLQVDTNLSQGLHVMLSIDELDRFKKECGYEDYIKLIKKVAQGLSQCANLSEHTLFARLNESDFFLLMPFQDNVKLKNHLDEMLLELKGTVNAQALEYLAIGVGIGAYNEQDTLKSLLSKADFTASQAKQNNNFTCMIEMKTQHSLILSREEWRKELVDGLSESRFIFATQNVIYNDGTASSIVHEEVFIRLKGSDGFTHSAGVFLPMAVVLGLADEIDRYMVQKMLQRFTLQTLNTTLALNLSAEFVSRYANIQWLKVQLEKLSAAQRSLLWFEVSSSIALHNLEAVVSLSSQLKMLGCRFGVDSFTIPPEGAYYLQAIRPDYVKCAVVYLKDIMLDASTGKSQESLNNIARSLGISIIATNIETEDELAMLKYLGINYMQGRLISSIELLVE